MNVIHSTNTVRNDALAYGLNPKSEPYDFLFADNVGFTPVGEILMPTQDNNEQNWYVNIEYDDAIVESEINNISGNLTFLSEDGHSKIIYGFDNKSEVVSYNFYVTYERTIQASIFYLNIIKTNENDPSEMYVTVGYDEQGNPLFEDVSMIGSQDRFTNDNHLIDYENQSIQAFIDSEENIHNEPFVLEHDTVDVLVDHIHGKYAVDNGFSVAHFGNSDLLISPFDMSF